MEASAQRLLSPLRLFSWSLWDSVPAPHGTLAASAFISGTGPKMASAQSPGLSGHSPSSSFPPPNVQLRDQIGLTSLGPAKPPESLVLGSRLSKGK